MLLLKSALITRLPKEVSMPIDLTAPITAVTVYTNRARVTRSASIDLEQGETTLVLSGLPEVMDADSVRVSGKGAGITIRGVDVKPDVLEESASKKSLQEQYDDLRKQAKALEHELKTLDEKIDYYKSLKTQASEDSGTALLKDETSFERVTAIADYIEEQLKATYARHRETGYKWGTLNDQIKAVQIRMADDQPQETKRGQAIHIAVEAETAMTFTYEIDYLVQNAFWKPLYDVRLLEDNSVELTYMARITQETGEDWEEVALSLSTARPALQSQLPKLGAWYVGATYNEAYPNRYPNAGVSRFQRLRLEIRDEVNSLQDTIDSMEQVTEQPIAPNYDTYDDYEGEVLDGTERSRRRVLNPLGAVADAVTSAAKAVMPQDKVANVSQTTIAPNTSGAIVTYTVGTPVSILGNGEPHKTTIVITGLKAELDYLTAPRLAPEAYLRATITNTSDYTILPGEASVFHENDFVGKTQLVTIAPNDEFKVQLGVDDRIKVERELVKRDTSARFIGTMAQTNFQYAIKLKNLLPEKAKVTVQDQFPVSKSSKINVKLDSVSPKPKDESELHILTWELELEPQQERTITLAFTVEHGRNQPVYGLDD
jgi:hypothetical protein